jgi:CRISPR-associated protein Cmr2
MTRLLHFTLGPVQGFVAQARRTSDLWAGSFLLSWLAGQAMCAVAAVNGKIIVPDVRDDALYEAIAASTGGLGPAVGSLPNRFKARVPDGFDPKDCRAAVLDAWQRLAGHVWEGHVAPVTPLGNDTEAIWQRQIGGFWETAWVVGADPGDGSDGAWLDRRKNWRTHHPPVEGGDHCMLMGDWQELSGFVRSRERGRQDEFWQALKAQIEHASGNPLDLDEGERLCAMALIKRLFLRVAPDALGWTPCWDDEQPVRWPSTPRLAATGWLGDAGKTDEAKAFVAAARSARHGLTEPALEPGNELSRVPGALLHRSGIENARGGELVPDGGNTDAVRQQLLDAYRVLTDKAGEPSAFYALLQMDGDHVGALLRQEEGSVTGGLAAFSRGVDMAIGGHRGNAVYAGGDDVLALLPLEGALPAALALRQAYRDAFQDQATISAAIVFAHFHVPLRHVLHEARRQLEDVAKAENGRDSLALCMLSQSGVIRQWVSLWDSASISVAQTLIEASQEIREQTSGGFFYAIAQRYRAVLAGAVLAPEELKQILLAEYRHIKAAAKGLSADQVIDRMFVLAERHAAKGSVRETEAPPVAMDGPLIARFLARERRAR